MSMYIPSVGEAARKIVKYYEEGAIDDLNAVGEYLENNVLQNPLQVMEMNSIMQQCN